MGSPMLHCNSESDQSSTIGNTQPNAVPLLELPITTPALTFARLA
jgi:hypothetical protein